jgi:hypothetical protein
MRNREDNIKELCECVLGTIISVDQNQYNYRKYYSCPLCGAFVSSYDNKVWTMDTIQHKSNCGYLIAKDLMTNKE